MLGSGAGKAGRLGGTLSRTRPENPDPVRMLGVEHGPRPRIRPRPQEHVDHRSAKIVVASLVLESMTEAEIRTPAPSITST